MARSGNKKNRGNAARGGDKKAPVSRSNRALGRSASLRGKAIVAPADTNTKRTEYSSAGEAGKKRSAPRSEQFKPVAKSELPKQLYSRPAPGGARLAEKTAVILETEPDANYALLDSGLGRKLERYGPYTIIRPEAQAIWQPLLPQDVWVRADAVFTGDTEEEGLGRWQFPRQADGSALNETWPMAFEGMPFLGRFTSFRHVGVFPEQAAHWRFIEKQITEAVAKGGRKPRILNLFGYTGIASLVAARAGAEVTHVDASKKAIGWARENQERAGLGDAPVRWICDDAMKFSAREVRREQTYDGILLDPPAYGRGPKGEVWQLFDNLTEQLDLCRGMLSDQAMFVVLTSYAIRASFFAMHEIMQECFAGTGGQLESGELILRQESGDRVLSTSMFSRWTPDVSHPKGGDAA